jgi:hypothetical protein
LQICAADRPFSSAEVRYYGADGTYRILAELFRGRAVIILGSLSRHWQYGHHVAQSERPIRGIFRSRLVLNWTSQPIRSPQRPPNQSGCILHDLKPLSLQFEYYGHGQMRAFLRLDPIRPSPFRFVFLWGNCERPSERRTRSHPLDHPTFNLPLSDALLFSSLSLFPLLDEPQPRKINGDDHHASSLSPSPAPEAFPWSSRGSMSPSMNF